MTKQNTNHQKLAPPPNSTSIGGNRGNFIKPSIRTITVNEAKQIVPTSDMEDLAKIAWQNARPKSQRWCLRSVKENLQRLGFIPKGKSLGPKAVAAIPALRRHPGFIEVKGVKVSDLKYLPLGTVVIYPKPGNPKAAGHAQILVGNGKAASDYRHGLMIYSKNPSSVYAFIPIEKGEKISLDPRKGGGTYSINLDNPIKGDRGPSLYKFLRPILLTEGLYYQLMVTREQENKERRKKENKSNGGSVMIPRNHLP